jgi:hypothetical protein
MPRRVRRCEKACCARQTPFGHPEGRSRQLHRRTERREQGHYAGRHSGEQARQAKNTEAEARACEIRLRAERKAGQLLQQDTERAGKGRPPKMSCATTLSDLGISRDQSARWQQLADVPEDQFEATFSRPGKPSTNGIIKEAQGVKPSRWGDGAASCLASHRPRRNRASCRCPQHRGNGSRREHRTTLIKTSKQ